MSLAKPLRKAVRTQHKQLASLFNDMNPGVNAMPAMGLLAPYPTFWINGNNCKKLEQGVRHQAT